MEGHVLCNLSCYCKRNFPASVGLFGDNKSTKVFVIELSLQLTCFVKDKQTLETEDTLYKLDIFRHRPICGLFPLKCQSLRQTFQRIIQTIICETPSPLLLLVLFARTKLNSRTSLESLLSLPALIFGYLKKRERRKTQLNTSSWINSLFTHGRV